MAEPCFKCEAELVTSARLCHRCGAPTLSAGPGRSLAMQATAEARAEIKEVVRSASAQPTATGTHIRDRVLFSAPLGPIGRAAEAAWVRPMLQRLFLYRRNAIRQRFPR